MIGHLKRKPTQGATKMSKSCQKLIKMFLGGNGKERGTEIFNRENRPGSYDMGVL